MRERPAPVIAETAPSAAPPCGKIDRGAEQRGHEFIGRALADGEASGGHVMCGAGAVWQFRFGTLCGDFASFHDVVTVELHAGKVRRVWKHQAYNAAWCGGPDG